MPRKMKNKRVAPSEEPPAKRTKFLSDDEDEDSDVDGANGVTLPQDDDDDDDETFNLKINEDFAKRFEYNKKREEKAQLEEKYKHSGAGVSESESDSETSEEEDDDAELVTADLDEEIFATLEAIKKKDPRVYNKDVTFYKPFDPDAVDNAPAKKEKPMHLSDYHRKNLLEGNIGDEEDEAPVRTYAQEQEDLKTDLIKQMHDADADEEGDDDEFLVKKPKKEKAASSDAPKRSTITEMDIKNADRDPETFLSNFMAARAWKPDQSSRFQALDDDDSDEEKRAEEFETAYNLRFEDPAKANEKLMSYGRDVGKYGVRRDELSGRKKLREKERERKDAEKAERQEEKARLRKLKIEEVEEKVKLIKEAAGLKGKALDLSEWSQVLEEDWDDSRWEQEMRKRFGDKYYDEKDAGIAAEDDDEEDEEESADKKSKKPKKPTWDDDIDIKDILPEFEDDETERPKITLTDDEAEDDNDNDNEDDDDAMSLDGAPSTKRKTKKDRLAEKADARRVARKERMAIEELVDKDLSATLPTKQSAGFRYRETSPTSFGLTTKDILFADDAALNTFAGLKKMATWRDADKKRKDKKKLGKKARLRQWRKETFGDEEGFAGGFKEFLGEGTGEAGDEAAVGGSRKRRGKKRKTAES